MDELLSQKLDKFTKSVNAEVEERIDKIIDEANKISDDKLKKAEDDALLNAYNKIQKSVHDTEAKYLRMYALEEQKCKMEVLRHRETLSKTIFKDVEEKLVSFTDSKDYEIYLEKLIEKEQFSENAVIVLSLSDEKYAGALKKKYNNEIKFDDSIEIGGLLIIDSEQGLIIDKTFDSALEEQKKSFSSKYSFKAEV